MFHRSWIILLGSMSTALAANPPPSPLAPSAERATFQLADPALTIELVAAEPDVVSPVAVAWDDAGRMFVAEMTDYPVGPPSGRIRCLEGYEGPGRFRKVTLFAQDLPFPNGVLPWNGGLIVTAAPDVWFLKDTNLDGVADERRVLLTGLNPGNQQLRANAPSRGLDGWIYAANGRSDGSLRRPDDPPDRAVPLNLRDFRFRPDGEIEPVAGFSQFGLGFNSRGDRFPSWNTAPVRHVVLEPRHAQRNPYVPAVPLVADILPSGDDAVFPIARPPRTFNRESVRAFNATAGTMIFRGDALGPAYQENAFFGETLMSLVQRRVLRPDGFTYVADRAEKDREFLASSDSWFHPVNFATGPDGALYVVDFYRRFVEHPDFVPPDRRGDVDWREGSNHGRIWRIARHDADRRPWDRLAGADSRTLVAALDDPIGWVRDTAQRRLVEQAAPESLPLLRASAREATVLGRVHALWTLANLGQATPAELGPALKDPSSKVREQAARIAETLPLDTREPLRASLRSLLEDAEPRVRFHAALALSSPRSSDDIAALARLARRDGSDPWARRALLTLVADHALEVARLLLDSPDHEAVASSDLVSSLGEIVGARALDDELGPAFTLAASRNQDRPSPARLALLSGLATGLSRSPRSLAQLLAEPPAALVEPAQKLRTTLDSLAQTIHSTTAPAADRALALRTHTLARPDDASQLVPTLLDPEYPAELQRAAAGSLAVLGRPELASAILEAWDRYTSPTRRALIAALVPSVPLARSLATALESGQVAPSELDTATRRALAQLPDDDLRRRFEAIFPPVDADRAAAVARYREAMETIGPDRVSGDPRVGAVHFARLCLTCHKVQGRGHEVGPSLAGVASRPREILADDILNPSREMTPDFRDFVVATRDGRVLNGLLESDDPSGVVLRGPEGARTIIPRAEVESLRPTGKSLMPEGFEAQLDPTALNDLIAFLREADSTPIPNP